MRSLQRLLPPHMPRRYAPLAAASNDDISYMSSRDTILGIQGVRSNHAKPRRLEHFLGLGFCTNLAQIILFFFLAFIFQRDGLFTPVLGTIFVLTYAQFFAQIFCADLHLGAQRSAFVCTRICQKICERIRSATTSLYISAQTFRENLLR